MTPLKYDWKIAVDKREWKPWLFSDLVIGPHGKERSVIIESQTVWLPTGDYSIIGLEDKVAVERKSRDDLYGTVGRGRERFERELDRLNNMQFACVIVEDEWDNTMHNPPQASKVAPTSVDGSIIAWMQRFRNVHWLMRPGRYEASRTCFQVLSRFHTEHENAK